MIVFYYHPFPTVRFQFMRKVWAIIKIKKNWTALMVIRIIIGYKPREGKGGFLLKVQPLHYKKTVASYSVHIHPIHIKQRRACGKPYISHSVDKWCNSY